MKVFRPCEDVRMEVPQRQLYIDGQWVRPSTGAVLDVMNPATEKKIGVIPAGGPRDVELAVQAAVFAFKSTQWSKSSYKYRAGFLRKIAQKVRSRGDRGTGFRALFSWFALSSMLVLLLSEALLVRHIWTLRWSWGCSWRPCCNNGPT